MKPRNDIASLLALLVLSTPAAASATVIADLLASPFGTSSTAPNVVYKTETASLFIDPASTTWMALSIGTDLRTNLPNLSGVPTIQSPQMNDAILLTATLGASTSAQIVLDDNDSFNRRLGNQAIFYGFFPSVGSFNSSSTATYAGLPETGALTSFFDANGAGVYTFDLSFLNRFGPEAGHSTVYLLRDVTSSPAPEPGSLALLGASLAAAALIRRRR